MPTKLNGVVISDRVLTREELGEFLRAAPEPNSRRLTPFVSAPLVKPLRWAYAIMTVPSRRKDLFPRTLASLAAAGFDRPLICIDGCTFEQALEYERAFHLPVEINRKQRKVNGAWMLSLWRLWLDDAYRPQKTPAADRFAIFQDDAVFVRGLREYLDASTRDEKVYWNLYTQRWNEKVVEGKPSGWHEGATCDGNVYHGKRQQVGAGAVALVFTRDAVVELLASRHMVLKPAGAGERGRQLVDGGIAETLNQLGYREVCHMPSLCQHTGEVSTIGHNNGRPAQTFLGEDWDARTLLQLDSGGGRPVPVTYHFINGQLVGVTPQGSPPMATRRHHPVQPKTEPPPPGEGPGAEFTLMANQLRVPGCKLCKDLARRMDEWGVEGCRQRRDEIIADIKSRQQKMGLAARLKAGFSAILTGMAKKMGPSGLADPVPWMVDECIRRAEEKERQKADAGKEQAKSAEAHQESKPSG